MPPTARPVDGAVSPIVYIVVVVVCGKTHSVVVIKNDVEHVTGVSAVVIHVDAVLGVGLVADRERPVLG